jgi:hypothetical protein
VVALATMIKHRGRSVGSLDKLVKIAAGMGAYVQDKGWDDALLAEIAREKFNLSSGPVDWSKRPKRDAFELLKKNAPCIASIRKDFKKSGGGHLIVVWKISHKCVFYNEPAAEERRHVRRRVGISIFLRGWKRRIIVVKK